jgi:hypothetical protein
MGHAPEALHGTRLDSTHPRAPELTLCSPNSVAAAIHPSIHPPLVLTGRRARHSLSPQLASQPARHGLPLSGPRSAPAALGSVVMPCDIGEGCLFPFPTGPGTEQEQAQEHPGSRRAGCTLRPSATCDAWAPRRRPTDRLGPPQRYCLPFHCISSGYSLQCRVGVETAEETVSRFLLLQHVHFTLPSSCSASSPPSPPSFGFVETRAGLLVLMLPIHRLAPWLARYPGAYLAIRHLVFSSHFHLILTPHYISSHYTLHLISYTSHLIYTSSHYIS